MSWLRDLTKRADDLVDRVSVYASRRKLQERAVVTSQGYEQADQTLSELTAEMREAQRIIEAYGLSIKKEGRRV